jgi:plasmid stability protein
MPTLVVKNLPDKLHAQLRRQAERNHRSVTKEVVSLLEQGLNTGVAEPWPPPPMDLRTRRPVTAKALARAVNEGRE